MLRSLRKRLLGAAQTVNEVWARKDVRSPKAGREAIAERRSARAWQWASRAAWIVRATCNDGGRAECGSYSLLGSALALGQAASALAAITFVAVSHFARTRGLTASWFTSQIRHVFGAQSASAAASD
jgi:hypothetical protein